MSAPHIFLPAGRGFSGINGSDNEVERSLLMRDFPIGPLNGASVVSSASPPDETSSASSSTSTALIILSVGLAFSAIIFSWCAGLALITVALGADQMFTLLQGCLALAQLATSLILEDHFNLVCVCLLEALLVSSVLFWLNRLVRNRSLNSIRYQILI